MKVLTADQIRAWDQFTIKHEPIASIDLMERAAGKCVEWLEEHGYSGKRFMIFCGKGNNGGDGLAIARMLAAKKNKVFMYIIETGQNGSPDFKTNLERLQNSSVDIHFMQSRKDFPETREGDIIIDALFGSGLSRRLEEIAEIIVEHLNHSGCEIISIDIPGGLFADRTSKGNTIIKATHTLSFQCYKLAFLVAENAEYIGKVHILDIGLHSEFFESASINAPYELINEELIHSIYKPRDPFTHKGKFGHALLVAGSYGKMGAAVLATQACLRSGVGLLTCHIPKCGYEIMQRTVPEAMVTIDPDSSVITKIDHDILKYNAIGIGPGIGTAPETKNALNDFITSHSMSLVLDADALNCIAMEKDLLTSLLPQSILTPHPKEFERLFGESKNDFERLEKAVQNAKLLDCLIVLKGHHTFIATASGHGYFNNTGNAGMAKGGSGDVLTGIITALVAQGYSSSDAAILAVYLHGLAGDIAAKKLSQEAMVAGDIIENLGETFLTVRSL